MANVIPLLSPVLTLAAVILHRVGAATEESATVADLPDRVSWGAFTPEIVLAGSGTTRDASTRFHLSGGRGARILAQRVVEASHAAHPNFDANYFNALVVPMFWLGSVAEYFLVTCPQSMYQKQS